MHFVRNIIVIYEDIMKPTPESDDDDIEFFKGIANTNERVCC
jgi:hypothetical protein